MQGSTVRGPFSRAWRALALATVLPVLVGSCTGSSNSDEAQAKPRISHRVLPVGWSGSGAYLAGRFALSQNDTTAASVFMLKALRNDPQNIELLQRSLIALAMDGHLPEAAQVSRRLLNYDGDAALAAMLVAGQEAKAGHWAEAEAMVAKLPRRGINSVLVPVITAWSRMGLGKTDSALEALQPMSQISSHAGLYNYHSALINDLVDRRKAADDAFRDTLVDGGRLPLRTLETAILYYKRTGQAAKQRDVENRYRQDYPESFDLMAAENQPRLVNSPTMGLAEAYFSAAVLLRQTGTNDLALIFGRMALDLSPNLPSCQILVAEILQDTGHLKEANSLLSSIDPKSPVSWATQLRLAGNLEALGDTDAAVKALESLSASNPGRSDPLITLGDLLRSHQRWGEAANAYSRALSVFAKPARESWPLLYARGISYERSNQWTLAESDLLKALEYEPNEPHVLNYLGYSWIDKGINLDRGQRMIEKAAKILPTDGDIIDSLGWAFYRAGKYQQAVHNLQRAVELHPDEAVINDHLGDALWQIGRREEARFQWQRAMISNPEPDLKISLEQKLQTGLHGTGLAK